MKKVVTLFALLLAVFHSYGQNLEPKIANANVRLSFLLFPFTPLLTVEVRTFGNVTLQLETNFVNTHGANLKHFFKDRMDGHYVFVGSAFVENKLLRDVSFPFLVRFKSRLFIYFICFVCVVLMLKCGQHGIVISVGVLSIFQHRGCFAI